mgnify:FL=1
MSRPNVLMIVCDQLRKDALGCYGNQICETPNIDKLAARGVCFDNTFAALPVCAPNRGSIMTGRYPTVNGLRSNGIVLPHDETTLMDVLRHRGYTTYGAGKMHIEPQWRYPGGSDPRPELAVNPQPDPWEMPWHGFDYVQVTEDNRVGPYGEYLERHGYDVWTDPHSFTFPQHITQQSAYPEEHHQTTWVADWSIEYLQQHPEDRPFFMYTSFVDPHHPFTPPAPYDTMYKPEDMPPPFWNEKELERWPEGYISKYYNEEHGHEAIGMHKLQDSDWQRIKAYYYGMVSLIDKQVGRLISTLEERGMLDNTIIVFTSDHGEMLGDRHLCFKGTLFDEVTSVPLIYADPRDGHQNERREQLTSSIDLMPTILASAGVDIPQSVQGMSLLPAVADESHELRDALLIQESAVRRTVRTHEAQLSWHGEGKHSELYDLTRDPNCVDNLWNRPEAAQLQQAMMEKLLRVMTENVDPVPAKLAPC